MPSHEAVDQARTGGTRGDDAARRLGRGLPVRRPRRRPGRAGCQSYEATRFLERRRAIETRAGLVLWQAGVVGTANNSAEAVAPRLEALVDALRQIYPDEHEVVVYEASSYLGIVRQIPPRRSRHSPTPTLQGQRSTCRRSSVLTRSAATRYSPSALEPPASRPPRRGPGPRRPAPASSAIESAARASAAKKGESVPRPVARRPPRGLRRGAGSKPPAAAFARATRQPICPCTSSGAAAGLAPPPAGPGRLPRPDRQRGASRRVEPPPRRGWRAARRARAGQRRAQRTLRGFEVAGEQIDRARPGAHRREADAAAERVEDLRAASRERARLGELAAPSPRAGPRQQEHPLRGRVLGQLARARRRTNADPRRPAAARRSPRSRTGPRRLPPAARRPPAVRARERARARPASGRSGIATRRPRRAASRAGPRSRRRRRPRSRERGLDLGRQLLDPPSARARKPIRPSSSRARTALRSSPAAPALDRGAERCSASATGPSWTCASARSTRTSGSA